MKTDHRILIALTPLLVAAALMGGAFRGQGVLAALGNGSTCSQDSDCTSRFCAKSVYGGDSYNVNPLTPGGCRECGERQSCNMGLVCYKSKLGGLQSVCWKPGQGSYPNWIDTKWISYVEKVGAETCSGDRERTSCTQDWVTTERRNELFCTIKWRTFTICNGSGECEDYGRIAMQGHEYSITECTRDPVQSDVCSRTCCTTPGGRSGTARSCGGKASSFCEPCPTLEGMHQGTCQEVVGGVACRYDTGSNAPDPGSDGESGVAAAQQNYDTAAAAYSVAREVVDEKADVRSEAKEAYAEAKEQKTEVKQEYVAAKASYKAAEPEEKADALVELNTAKGEYAQAVQAVADAKTVYAEAKAVYTTAKTELSAAKRTMKSAAAALKEAKKAAQ